MMKIGYLTDVLDVEDVDLIITKDGLVEIADYLFEDLSSTDFIIDGSKRLSHVGN